jgi:hypothetical protein
VADERKNLYPVRRDLNAVVLQKGWQTKKKSPLCVLAEGLVSKNSRSDTTAIELFVAGVGMWEARLQQLIGRLADGK